MDAICKCKYIDQKELESTIAQQPDAETIERLSTFFSVFGDGTRLKILYYLSRHELCVADLASLVKMGQSAVSHQLRNLRLNRLVKVRKEGTTSYYSLDDFHVQSIFEVALAHINEVQR